MQLYQPTTSCDRNNKLKIKESKKRIKTHIFQPVTLWQNLQTTKPKATYLSNQVNIQILIELSTDESQLT